MITISSLLKISSAALTVDSTYIDPSNFLRVIKSVHPEEIESCLKHFVIHNTPFVFKERPIIYEQIIKYLVAVLKVNTEDVKLIGSAKTGFSFSIPYGRQFDKGDLDFAIINYELFEKLRLEFENIKAKYEEGEIKLKPERVSYWQENIKSIPNNMQKFGFIDPNKIPYVQITPIASGMATSMSNLKNKLNEIHNIEISKASIRVYKNETSFIDRLMLNLTNVVKDNN